MELKSFNIVLLLAAALNASAATWYVRTDGHDGNDGKSWETAQESIRLGIDNCRAGDTLLVEAGVYHEGIILKDGVVIIGGCNLSLVSATIWIKPSWMVRTSARVLSRARRIVNCRPALKILCFRTHAMTNRVEPLG